MQHIEDELARISDPDKMALAQMIGSHGWALFGDLLEHHRTCAHEDALRRSASGIPGVDHALGYERAYKFMMVLMDEIRRQVHDGE